MARREKIMTGEIYHVYNRGTDNRVIFNTQNDYLRFLDSLYYFNNTETIGSLYENSFSAIEPDKKLVELLAYNLLPNHYHLVIKEVREGGTSQFIKSVAGGYAYYFNTKNDRSGSLFQGPYKAARISTQGYFDVVLGYVHFNHHVHQLGDLVSKSSMCELKTGKSLNTEVILSEQALEHVMNNGVDSLDAYEKICLERICKTVDDRRRAKNVIDTEKRKLLME